MTDNDIQEALVQPTRTFSIVWLLPVIALMIGAWLVYQALADAPVKITIEFASGTGIEVGKTKVLYEGLPVGVVKDLRLDERDQKGVIATVEMDNRTETFLREATQFWLVRPEISLSGITGLETIVTGNYIAMKIATTGVSAHDFVALDKPPAVDMSEPGLHLQLLSNQLGSIYTGAPVLYKRVVVGRVTDYELDTEQDKVVVSIVIHQPYGELITQKTRFWNSSGVRVRAGLDGIDIRMDSLLSLVQGGISFDATDTHSEAAAQNGDTFQLYADYATAQRGVPATIHFNSNDPPPTSGTRIFYRGFEVGVVRAVNLSDDHRSVIARVNMSPDMEEHLNTGARFWLVSPQISLRGISGLDTLIKGAYVEMDVGSGESTREFVALRKPPPVDENKPGLRVRLETSEQGSVSVGSPVLYRKMPVGVVENVSLSPSKDLVMIDVRIEPEYQNLVTSASRFWNASGVQFSGSLSKVTLRTESLASLLQGGIGFYNAAEDTGKPAKPGSVFRLYDDYESAQEKGWRIELTLRNAEGVGPGTAIRYQGITIGNVKSLQLKPDLSAVVVNAIVWEQPDRFVRQGSRFWLVQPKLSITGAANLETLVTGRYFEVVPGDGPTQRFFTVDDQAPAQVEKEDGLNLILVAPRLGSIREGLTVYYREVAVGNVTGFRLSDTADHVKIFINIKQPYAALVRDGSVFWNASGISVNVGLFRGAEIRTESLESILAGGIGFATPDNGADLPLAQAGESFRLHDELEPEWLLWKPRIGVGE